MSDIKQKLGSEQVRKSITLLVQEARICVVTELEINGETRKLGSAAMLTIFPVINSISETVWNDRSNTERLTIARSFPYFVNEMGKSPSWLIKSPSCSANAESIITDVRNGLVHAMALPPQVLLAKDCEQAKTSMDENPGKYDCAICIEQFIDEVERTAIRLVDENSDKIFDPKGRKGFGSVDTVSPSNLPGVTNTASSI